MFHNGTYLKCIIFKTSEILCVSDVLGRYEMAYEMLFVKVSY